MAGNRLLRKVLLGTGAVVALFAVWELAVQYGPLTRLAAGPADVFRWSLEHRGTLWRHTGITTLETIGAFFLALGLALLSGSVLDRVARWKPGAMAFLAASNGIPKVIFAPLFFVWLGYGVEPKIAMGALIAFFPMLVGFLHGLELVDPSMRLFLATINAPWRLAFLRVRLPWALRSLMAGSKIAIGLAMVGALVSEFINASQGLGYLVKKGEDDFDLPMQFSGILAATVVGLLLYLILEAIDMMWLSRFPPLRSGNRKV